MPVSLEVCLSSPHTRPSAAQSLQISPGRAQAASVVGSTQESVPSQQPAHSSGSQVGGALSMGAEVSDWGGAVRGGGASNVPFDGRVSDPEPHAHSQIRLQLHGIWRRLTILSPRP